MADRLNNMPKYVVSSTLKDPDRSNSTVLAGDVIQEVSKLKEELDGRIVVAGSIRLVRSLMENELVYELRLMIYPVVLGAGERLFGETSDQGRCASSNPHRRRPRLPHLRGRPRRLAGRPARALADSLSRDYDTSPQRSAGPVFRKCP